MDEKEKELREEIGNKAREAVEGGDVTGWFEELYKHADGDIDQIPWADLAPNRFLLDWDKGNRIEGSGRKALVVGCGLGDEALFLANRDFEVTAFDISEKAVEWAGKVHADPMIKYLVADMFEPPQEWIGAFDLVMEVYTIQALPLSHRKKAIEAIAAFVAPGGELIAVQRLRRDHKEEPDGPPWAVSKEELKEFDAQGLVLSDFDLYSDDEDEPIDYFVARYERG